MVTSACVLYTRHSQFACELHMSIVAAWLATHYYNTAKYTHLVFIILMAARRLLAWAGVRNLVA